MLGMKIACAMVFALVSLGGQMVQAQLMASVDDDFQRLFDEFQTKDEFLDDNGLVSRLDGLWFSVSDCTDLTVQYGPKALPHYLVGTTDATRAPKDLACGIEENGHSVTHVTDVLWSLDPSDFNRFLRIRLSGGSEIVVDATRFSGASNDEATAEIGSYNRIWNAQTGAALIFERSLEPKEADTEKMPLVAFLLNNETLDLTSIGIGPELKNLPGPAGNPVTESNVGSALIDLVQGYYPEAKETSSGVAFINPLTNRPAGYLAVRIKNLQCDRPNSQTAECNFDIGIVVRQNVMVPGQDAGSQLMARIINNTRARWSPASATMVFTDKRWQMAIDRKVFRTAIASPQSVSSGGGSPSAYDCAAHSLVVGPALASGFGC